MLLEFFKNPWVLMVLCMVGTFGEMFFAKKWFTSFTSKIKNVKAKRGLNVVLGMATCVALSAVQMYTLCDLLGSVYLWTRVIAAAAGATGVYLILEKVFGESEVNELGKAFHDVVSHSELFDGDLSTAGATEIAKKLFAITTEIDKKVAEKETKAIDEVVKKLDSFLMDGVVTEEEKREAQRLVSANGVALEESAYEKYKALLSK